VGNLNSKLWRKVSDGPSDGVLRPTWKAQNVGRSVLRKIAQCIAHQLKLPEEERYTGHSFRRSAASIASNAGATLMQLKGLGGWKSDAAAQRYIEKSLPAKETAAALTCMGPVPAGVLKDSSILGKRGREQGSHSPPNGVNSGGGGTYNITYNIAGAVTGDMGGRWGTE
jgi:hypothetical protein